MQQISTISSLWSLLTDAERIDLRDGLQGRSRCFLGGMRCNAGDQYVGHGARRRGAPPTGNLGCNHAQRSDDRQGDEIRVDVAEFLAVRCRASAPRPNCREFAWCGRAAGCGHAYRTAFRCRRARARRHYGRRACRAGCGSFPAKPASPRRMFRQLPPIRRQPRRAERRTPRGTAPPWWRSSDRGSAWRRLRRAPHRRSERHRSARWRKGAWRHRRCAGAASATANRCVWRRA